MEIHILTHHWFEKSFYNISVIGDENKIIRLEGIAHRYYNIERSKTISDKQSINNTNNLTHRTFKLGVQAAIHDEQYQRDITSSLIADLENSLRKRLVMSDKDKRTVELKWEPLGTCS